MMDQAERWARVKAIGIDMLIFVGLLFPYVVLVFWLVEDVWAMTNIPWVIVVSYAMLRIGGGIAGALSETVREAYLESKGYKAKKSAS